ncbi:acyl-CoA dehydrogenase [Amycolatopsis mediterranei S699]|uniref:Acyl-CoA dehydrogenase n=2 Tax=Amycolatopsis mediterranei TaxID=33910 RepID=A0A0H3DFX8_AMYMU|nr:acyl-CoA dehydrogenase family protein [Amycolatopsis mediterranei]ADJ48574.1 acyl-CoA dehydrogenase [Amycolatopsis mediterranei U32]AEK45504.1 acyl-CoA dehydrogenase [Amycolatopsis mediterranei S699]AFO80283.1 acyl-CoA dehydrogenase [Amycolatopsis mediterranei S699]AGT87411.1 acyl-CoA dehydrogenase [Amycolatopsis mediterranei RB]KDO11183.1 acyl-CoA dehydrogenase [Amycolatopsis mediterranei]
MSQTPTRDELVQSASKLVPLLRSRALWIDEHRRLPDDVVEAIELSGILKMQAPKQYGGYESDAHSLIDVHAELARGNSSAAFCVSVYALLNWMAGLWPDEVLDEVFATENVRVCGTLATTGTATKVDGGYRISGTWRFNSGILHAQWKVTAAVPDGPEAAEGPITTLIPVSDLEIVDDWYTHGLPGSGSVTVTAHDVFVPSSRIVKTYDFFTDQCKSVVNSTKPNYYLTPMLVTSTAATAGQLIGAAKYALESFLDRLPGRGISYTHYPSQAEAPITHIRVGEAGLLIEEAEARAHRFADLIEEKLVKGEVWTVTERASSRVQLGRVAQLCKQAVDLIATISGGSSIFHDVPITRIQRDVNAVAIHALTNPDTSLELYGRLLCGLEPNTDYL